MALTGIVIKSTGNWYQVQSGNEIFQCRIIGKFRLDDKILTNPLGVGDQVEFELEKDNNGLIKKILPRKNYIVRQSPRQKHHLHMIAANIDQAMLVVTLLQPNFKQGFIDRYLLMTEPQNIPTVIIINKSDLFESYESELYDELKSIYEGIGYLILKTSSVTGEGMEKLKSILSNKVTIIGGQSGVGKSTLINYLQPHLDLRTTDISEHSGKGTHTTTFAEMYPLDFGGQLIDTPGIKTLSFNNLSPMDVAHNFREFFLLAKNCKYGDCIHRNEPGCAVKADIGKGMVHTSRYETYLSILEEIESQNYWELHEM
ncbi:MAG: ribosome small subunit-dependent GTPase A [Saprospiraceae bacterium]